MRRLTVLPLLGLLLLGCAGGPRGTEAVTGPDPAGGSEVIPSLKPQVTHEFVDLRAGAGMIGIYSVDLDLEDVLNASVEPVRSAKAIADTYLVDISTILRSAPCGDCLQVAGIKLEAPDVVAVTFQLKHPFTSMAGRKDLHVFDVRGHLVSGRGLKTFPGVTADLGSGPEPIATNGTLMVNADGYSTFFDGVAEGFIGANVPGNTRPYKLFWEDLTAGTVNPLQPTGWQNVDAPTGHNVFPMTGALANPKAKATYQLRLNPGDTALSFLFMVDAAYGVSATLPTRLEPRYFLPLFNQAAPIRLDATVANGMLIENDPTSEIVLDVQVGDWQAGFLPPDTGFNPATAKLNDIAFNSDLASLSVHIPGVLNAPVTVAPATKLGGSGQPTDPYRFSITLQNQAGAGIGSYTGIVKAEDEATLLLSEGPTALNRDAVTPDPDYHDFNTYQLFQVQVEPVGNLPPVAQIVASRTTVPTGGEVEFCPGSLTGDPDGSIILWEYDYDYDGVPANFAADAIRTPADSDKCATTNFTNPGEEPIARTVALRVTDNGTPGLRAIDAVEITIAPFSNEPPVAELTASNINPDTGEEITLMPGPGTMDPDGAITQWEYDFDWDGNPANFSADVTKSDNSPVPHTYFNPGPDDLLVTAGLRVTDNGDPMLTATDDLLITVVPPPANQPPTVELIVTPQSPLTGQQVELKPGPGTGDPDGTVVFYEYDFDWDGIPANFVADISNTDGAPVFHNYTNPGMSDLDITAALRVTDDGAPGLTAIGSKVVTVRAADPTPVWDFENPADTLAGLGFSLLGTNGLEKGPVAPCQLSKNYNNDPPASYQAPPPGTTWGLVEGIGNDEYPGNTTYRALEESGSTADPGEDNRYWSDAIYAIRTPLIPLPATGTLSLDLHHWFETDFEYEVDEVAPGGVSPFWWEPFPNPGKVTNYDGATLWVRPAPGGVPGPTATRLDLTGPQAAEPFWVTFNNAAGYRWELDLNAFRFYPFLETTEWLQTNYVAGVDKGFSGTSYGPSVDDRRNAIPQAQPGGWGVNTAQAEWIDSTFDLTPWAGQEVVLEFRFASKKKQNGACRNPPLVGTTFYPQCLECMQNLEALVDTSPNHRRSRGWRIDRIEVRQD